MDRLLELTVKPLEPSKFTLHNIFKDKVHKFKSKTSIRNYLRTEFQIKDKSLTDLLEELLKYNFVLKSNEMECVKSYLGFKPPSYLQARGQRGRVDVVVGEEALERLRDHQRDLDDLQQLELDLVVRGVGLDREAQHAAARVHVVRAGLGQRGHAVGAALGRDVRLVAVDVDLPREGVPAGKRRRNHQRTHLKR